MRIREAALFYRGVNRGSTKRSRSPAKISDINDIGVTVKFHSQTSRVARFSLRKKAEGEDVKEAEWNPA